MTTSESPRREYHYRVDRDGTLHHAGDPITHPRVLTQFYRNLRLAPDGRLVSICAGETNVLEADDTPFVVVGVLPHRGDDGRLSLVDVVLNDGSIERLDVRSLEIGPNDVLYGRVRSGMFRARFRRAPHASLLQFAEERGSEIVLEVGKDVVRLAAAR